MLPDELWGAAYKLLSSQCTYRCVVLPDLLPEKENNDSPFKSQCTYRCVVLPDGHGQRSLRRWLPVSMHLQVRGAP